MSTTDARPLCFRCEYRAYWLENNIAQRYECKSSDESIDFCYMFKPVKPIFVKKDDNKAEKNVLSPRMYSPIEDPKLKLSVKKYEKQTLIYWTPKV